LNTHHGLLELVQQFLEHIHWERGKSDLARKVCTSPLLLLLLLLLLSMLVVIQVHCVYCLVLLTTPV